MSFGNSRWGTTAFKALMMGVQDRYIIHKTISSGFYPFLLHRSLVMLSPCLLSNTDVMIDASA